MAVQRWDARFEGEQLVLRRWRLLPWPKAYSRRIPLVAIRDIRSATAADHSKRRAQLTVQDASALHIVEAIPVRFTAEQWTFAGWFLQGRQEARIQPPGAGAATPPRPAAEVPARSRGGVRPSAASQAHLSAKAAGPSPSSQPATPVMRVDDGKRQVWLWPQNGEIQGSLVPVADALPRWLSPAQVAHLLLSDLSRTMPAIHALTGISDIQQALAQMRIWQRSEPVVVNLPASDLAGRRVTEAQQKPGRSNPDGTVRTVSGGLPSLNKRRR
ncbi:hypothetical protein ABZ780_02780 [Micromonospora sp. NPDC047467]|uniref:hypothetical protein n=1 Tax=Micromonospora sp. NPDC047467 TaxID=3154814 RepID=UPI0033D0BE5B